MKKSSLFLINLLLLSFLPLRASEGNDIKDIFNKIGGSGSTSDIIGSVVNGVLSNSNITIKDIVGTWNYVEPAVEFKSDNLLQKAGGAAAAKTITNKIKPFFDKANMDRLVFTVAEDGTFKLGVGGVSASGTIEKSTDGGCFIFNFKAGGKVNLGKINAYMSKNVSGQLTLTFDASKIISLVNTIAKISSNSTVQTVSSLLNSYDGLTVGFLMKKG